MNFSWNETKRQTNLQKHGLDFADAEKVFNGPLVLFEDPRGTTVNSAQLALGYWTIWW